MKLVLTLLCRDNADVVDAQIAFHLNAGVDFVVATDNRSVDGTREVLDGYARAGHLHLIDEPGEDIRQGEWVTRMARLAASEFGADWVINSDADEFWWPRGGDLKEVLSSVPARYGVVRALWRNFVPRPDDGAHFAERMTVRLAAHAPINDPTSPYRPMAKIAHRAAADVVVGGGNHELVGSSLLTLRGWCPIEILHFPLRSLEQCQSKYLTAFAAWSRNERGVSGAYHARAFEAWQEGRLDAYYAALTVDDDDLARGLADGSLVVDTRLRDALRLLHTEAGDGTPGWRPPSGERGLDLPRPTVVDDAAYAAELTVLDEANVVRLQRQVDELERRLLELEQARRGRLQRRVVARLLRVALRRTP